MSDSKNAAWIGKAASLDGKSWCYRVTVRLWSQQWNVYWRWVVCLQSMKICNEYFSRESIRVAKITPEKYYPILQKKKRHTVLFSVDEYSLVKVQYAVCWAVCVLVCLVVFTLVCSVRHAERFDLPCLPVASFVLFTAQRGIPTRSSFISTIFCFYLEQLRWIFFISYFCFLLYLCWIFLMFSFCWSPLLGTTSPSNFNSFLLIQNHAKPKQNQPCYMKANY